MRKRVYVVAAEYSAPLSHLRPVSEASYQEAPAHTRPDAHRRVFFAAPRDRETWADRGASAPPALTDLLASAAHNALGTLSGLVGGDRYVETRALVSDLLVASMPLLGFAPSSVNPGLIPQILASALGLDSRCRAQFITGTADSGAHAFGTAVRIAQGQPATILLVAGQTIPAGYAGQYRIRSVFTDDEQARGLDMMAIGDVLMDSLRRTHAEPSYDVTRCQQWLDTVRQRKIKAAESYPAAMGVRPADEGRAPGLARRVTRYFRSGDVAPSGCGAAAVLLTSDDALMARIRKTLALTQQVPAPPATRYRDTPVIEVMGVGDGTTNPRVLRRDNPVVALSSIRQALAGAADDADLPMSVYPDSAFAVLYDAFPSVELAFLLSIGLDWRLATLRMATWWTNPYGGLLTFGHAIGASGLVQICKAFHAFVGDRRYVTVASRNNPVYRFRRHGSHAFATSIGGPLSHVVVSLLRGGVPLNMADQERFFDGSRGERDHGSRSIREHRRRRRMHEAVQTYLGRLRQRDPDLCLIEGITEVDARSCAQGMTRAELARLPLPRLALLVTDAALPACRDEVIAQVLALRDASRAAEDTTEALAARRRYNESLAELLEAWAERGALRDAADSDGDNDGDIDASDVSDAGGRADAAQRPEQLKLLKQCVRAQMALLIHARDGARHLHYLPDLAGLDDADFVRLPGGEEPSPVTDATLLPWWSIRARRPAGPLPLRGRRPGSVYRELSAERALADERPAELAFLRAYFAPFGPQAAVDLALRDLGVGPRLGDASRADEVVPAIFYKNDIIQSSDIASVHEAYELLGRAAQRARGWLGMYSSTCAQHGDSVSLVALDRRLEASASAFQDEALHARREAICNAARFARDVAEWCLGFGIRLRTVVSFGNGVPYQDVNDDRSVASDSAIRGARLLDFVAAAAHRYKFEALSWIAFDWTELTDIDDAEVIFANQLETASGPGWRIPEGPTSPAPIDRWDAARFTVWYRLAE